MAENRGDGTRAEVFLRLQIVQRSLFCLGDMLGLQKLQGRGCGLNASQVPLNTPLCRTGFCMWT